MGYILKLLKLEMGISIHRTKEGFIRQRSYIMYEAQ